MEEFLGSSWDPWSAASVEQELKRARTGDIAGAAQLDGVVAGEPTCKWAGWVSSDEEEAVAKEVPAGAGGRAASTC
jgi:hypothetical protein